MGAPGILAGSRYGDGAGSVDLPSRLATAWQIPPGVVDARPCVEASPGRVAGRIESAGASSRAFNCLMNEDYFAGSSSIDQRVGSIESAQIR